MAATVVTPEDLEIFKNDLLQEIKKLLSQVQHNLPEKWLKTKDVRRLLKASQGTIQHLRITGVLPFTKVGGTFYYSMSDIDKMLKDNKTNRDFPSRKSNPWRKI